jgi:hypothetical protein
VQIARHSSRWALPFGFWHADCVSWKDGGEQETTGSPESGPNKAKELVMKRMGLILALFLVATFAGSQAAMAGHGYHGHGHYRANYGYRGVYGRPYLAGYGGYYGVGPAYAVPVPAYGYPAYPPAGFGVAGRNFSLWFGQ